MTLYLPAHFEETNINAAHDLMAARPLATVVANTPDGLSANHIPLMVDGDEKLIGHIALANDMHRVLEDNADVLCIFHGEDTYISPNSYPSKAEHHKHVPTWNYQVVHVYGRIRFAHETKVKRAIVGRLTQSHERATNGDDAWRMADAPKDYMDTMLDNIVGFDIAIDRIIGKSKLSQNRDARDYENVRKTLTQRGEHALASRMMPTKK